MSTDLQVFYQQICYYEDLVNGKSFMLFIREYQPMKVVTIQISLEFSNYVLGEVIFTNFEIISILYICKVFLLSADY